MEETVMRDLLQPWQCECGAEVQSALLMPPPPAPTIWRFRHGDNPEHIFELTDKEFEREATLNPNGYLGDWLDRLHRYETTQCTQDAVP